MEGTVPVLPASKMVRRFNRIIHVKGLEREHTVDKCRAVIREVLLCLVL